MNIKDIWEDDDFKKLSNQDKAQVLNYVIQLDPDFRQLPPEEKGKVRQFLIQKISQPTTVAKETIKQLPSALKQTSKELLGEYKKVPQVALGLTFRLPSEISTFAKELYESPITPHPVKEALTRTIEKVKKGQLTTPSQYLEEVYIDPGEMTPKQAFFTTLGTELLGQSADILLNPFWHPKSLKVMGQAVKTATAPIISKVLFNTTLERLTKETVKEIEAGIKEAPDWYKKLGKDDRAKVVKELFEKGETVIPVKTPKPFVVKLDSILNTPWGKGWWQRVKARWEADNIPEQITKEIGLTTQKELPEHKPEIKEKPITTPPPEEVKPPIAVEPPETEKVIQPQVKPQLTPEKTPEVKPETKPETPSELEPLAEKLPRAEEFAKKLGIETKRTKSRTGVDVILSRDPKTGKSILKIPETLDINSPETQFYIWHEIGHYFDQARFHGGRGQMTSQLQWGKYSTPNYEVLKKYKDYILKDRKLPELQFRIVGTKKVYNSLEEMANDKSVPPEILKDTKRKYEQWLEKVKNYITQDIELFAEGFAKYITNRASMLKEAPELVEIYDEILKKEPAFTNLWKTITEEVKPEIKPPETKPKEIFPEIPPEQKITPEKEAGKGEIPTPPEKVAKKGKIEPPKATEPPKEIDPKQYKTLEDYLKAKGHPLPVGVENPVSKYQRDLYERLQVAKGKEKQAIKKQYHQVISDIEKWNLEHPYGYLMEEYGISEEEAKRAYDAEQREKQFGGIKITIPDIEAKFKEFWQNIKKATDTLRYYPKAPPDLQESIRKIYGQLKENINNGIKLYNTIKGNLNDRQENLFINIVYALDEVERQKLGIGNPTITLEQAEKLANDLLKEADLDTLKALDVYKKITQTMGQKLVEVGLLPEDAIHGFYAPHIVEDYANYIRTSLGLPSRGKYVRPFFTKKAVGSPKEIRKTKEVLITYFAETDWVIKYHKWLEGELTKWDITPSLDDELKRKLFGEDKLGRVKPYGKPGHKYNINGKTYVAYSPEWYTRQLYTTETGEVALGRYKRTYLVPENVAYTFNHLKDNLGILEPMGYILDYTSKLWKSTAILSHYIGFNVNNFCGDTYKIIAFHPEPFTMLNYVGKTVKFVFKNPKQYTEIEKGLAQFINEQDILGAGYTSSEFLKQLNKLEKLTKREAFWRLVNAYYLYAEGLIKGRIMEIADQIPYIPTKGLTSVRDIAGKIGREILTDYARFSRTFNKLIRTFVAPFSPFYLVNTLHFWKSIKKPKLFLQILGAGFAYKVLQMAWNKHKTKDKYYELPDFIRENGFVVKIYPDGRIKALMPQFFLDQLIGTKFVPILLDYADQYKSGKITLQQAKQRFLRHWGEEEIRGITQLMPLDRLIVGIATGVDPFTQKSIYRADTKMMTPMEVWEDKLMFIASCFTPMLTTYMAETLKGSAKQEAVNTLMEKVLNPGIYDFLPTANRIQLPDGKEITYDDLIESSLKKRKIESALNNTILTDFENQSLPPNQYVLTERFKQKYNMFYETIKDATPDEQQWWLKRMTYQLFLSPEILKKWAYNNYQKAQTDYEKAYWSKKIKAIETYRFVKKVLQKSLPEKSDLFMPEVSK